jgi:6-phosphofructokinase 2
MVTTITLNPAIDKGIRVPYLVPEKKMRCPSMSIEAGGGGINVSKALQELNVSSRAVFFKAGFNGNLLERILKDKHIETLPLTVSGETRENIVVDELSTNKQYKFVMPGNPVAPGDLSLLMKYISELNDTTYLVCSGSLPPGVSPSCIKELAALTLSKNMKLVIDTSGEALKEALATGVYLLKPNLSELCFLVGKKYLEINEIADAAAHVMASGKAEVLVISMGPAGAMLVTKDFQKMINAPVVKKLSTVGAGDSMIAGIIAMLSEHQSIEKAVTFGIACGTAATINKGTQLFNKEDAYRFYKWMINRQT